jgi:hypothetical protein
VDEILARNQDFRLVPKIFVWTVDRRNEPDMISLALGPVSSPSRSRGSSFFENMVGGSRDSALHGIVRLLDVRGLVFKA